MRTPRPLIAINGELTDGDVKKLVAPMRYAQAVERAGGIPFILPLLGDIDGLLEHVDGLLLGGGDDFDTERLGLGPTHPEAKPVPTAKQDFDVALAKRALARGIPTLGVCYGMQLLGLVGGGRLHQHLPTDRPGSREHRGGVEHSVRVEPGSRLFAICGAEELPTVSRHHQALAETGPGWAVCARDDEGLIEGIEHESLPFVLGTQWHPELSAEGGLNDLLFGALIQAAAEVHAARATAARTALLANASGHP